MPEYQESPLGFGREMFTFPYGHHIFVLARPLDRDWSSIDGSTMRSGTEEWRPMRVSGHGTGQRLCAIGSPYAYQMDEFEIGPILDIEHIMGQTAAPQMKV